MDWLARAAWIYESNTPDYTKLASHSINVVYVDPRSPNAASVIASLHAHSLTPGIYEVPGWYGYPPPADFAKTVSQHANALIPRPPDGEAPPLMLDLEAVSREWQAEAVAAYRRYQPRRPTAYTNEPFKDGTVVPVQTLISAGVHWYPQLYRGDMSPVDAAAVVLEIARWGYPASMIHPFYDGARLPGDWRDGCVFTLERIP